MYYQKEQIKLKPNVKKIKIKSNQVFFFFHNDIPFVKISSFFLAKTFEVH